MATAAMNGASLNIPCRPSVGLIKRIDRVLKNENRLRFRFRGSFLFAWFFFGHAFFHFAESDCATRKCRRNKEDATTRD